MSKLKIFTLISCLLTCAALNMGCVSIDSNGNAVYSSSAKNIDDDRVSASKAALSVNCLHYPPSDDNYYEEDEEEQGDYEDSVYEEWDNDEA